MDLVLTGRAVGAAEAYQMGLANRVVPIGAERVEAENLAREIARFPATCMRHDRRSLIEQTGRSEADAMSNEWQHGQISLRADARDGAARFAAGAGRGGSFNDSV